MVTSILFFLTVVHTTSANHASRLVDVRMETNSGSYIIIPVRIMLHPADSGPKRLLDHPSSRCSQEEQVANTHCIRRVWLSQNGFSVLEDGFITGAQPAAGIGGTYVDITGVDMFGGGSSIRSLTLAGITATVVSANNSFIRVQVRLNR